MLRTKHSQRNPKPEQAERQGKGRQFDDLLADAENPIRGAEKHPRSGLALRIRRLLAARKDVIDQIQGPNLAAVRAAAALFDECLAGANGGLDVLARHAVLLSAFPAFLWYRRRDSRRASEWLVRCSAICTGAAIARPLRPVFDPQSHEYLALWGIAVEEIIANQLGAARGRDTLRRLSAHLGVGQDELGRMFGVAGETVRRWLSGAHEIPDARLAELDSTDAALRRLVKIFRPERLRQVIRRPAELFGGERALDWMLRGRIADVARRYEAAFSYQG